ncbi:hypothetical protein [Gimesia maris]|uniref:hypothetical protein n=1 Tax=Gimesia maris TaxID=122 RepID=UPI0030D75829
MISSLLFLALLPGTAVQAEKILVGKTELEIPAPKGFVRVTPEIAALIQARSKSPLASTRSELLAEYLPRDDVQLLREGKPPSQQKVCFLHVDENLKHKFVGTQGFQELKKTTKEENREFREKVRKQDPKLFDELIAKIEEKSDQQLEMDVPEILLLKAHSETPLMLSYSTIYTVRFSDKTGLKKMVRGCTMTDLDPAGKVLLMICDAPQAEVEWTRAISQNWSEAILNANHIAPSGGFLEIDDMERQQVWLENRNKIIYLSAVLGIGLIYLFVRIRRPQKTDIPEEK